MKKLLLAAAILAFPLSSLALTMDQVYTNPAVTQPSSNQTQSVPSVQLSTISNGNQLVGRFLNLLDIAIYVLVAVGVVFIVYHVVMYIIAKENPDEKTKALGNVGWGLVGLFVIVSLWGLVNILVNTFKTTTNTLPNLPNADFVHNSSGE